jgi:RimJ/RimL family protein N-acetyltransferase
MGIEINRPHDAGELGYWIGKPYWNQGYCTEAAKAVLRYVFSALELNRVGAIHFTRNPASGRVMQKIGMRYEGERRQALKRWGEYVDIACYGILREDLESMDVGE